MTGCLRGWRMWLNRLIWRRIRSQNPTLLPPLASHTHHDRRCAAAYLQGTSRGLAAAPWLYDLGRQTSRGFRALKIWMALKGHGAAKFGQLIDQNIAGGMPPVFRNNLVPTGCDIPAPSAASSLVIPCAILNQNRWSSDRPATGGRPGDGNSARPERCDRRFRMPIATFLRSGVATTV